MNEATPGSRDPSSPTTGAWVLAALALLMLLPVTLPVPVLRELVKDRFGVSEQVASLFMSVNMVGAVLSAPISGALADSIGKRKPLVVGALLANGALLWLLVLPVSFPVFMAIRFFEGAAHILALSVLLAIAAESGTAERRGRVMGLVGAGLTLGVALGAPLGGAIGREDPLLTLRVGSVLVVATAAFAAWKLGEPAQRRTKPGFREIVRLVQRDRLLLVPLAYAFVERFTVGFFTTTFSFYLGGIHAVGRPQRGILLALFLLPFALLSYPFGRLSERVSRTVLVCGGSVIYGVFVMTLGWWPLAGLPLLMVLLGVTAAVMFVPSLVMTTDLAAAEIRATAIGGFNAAGSLGFILGPVTGGWVSEAVAASSGWHAGYRAAFVVAGLSEIVCVAVTLPFLLRLVRAGRTT